MNWFIDDYDRRNIYITNMWQEWLLPKFQLAFSIDGDYLEIYWNDRQKGPGGDSRRLKIDYRDVVDGYSGYVSNPSSAADLQAAIEAMQDSAWTSIGGGGILTAKSQLLGHDGVSDTIIVGGPNEYLPIRDDTTATGYNFISKVNVVAGGLSVTDSSTIDFTKSGGDITGSVKLSASAGNAITDSSGLYAPDAKWTHLGHYGTSFADSTTLYFAGSAFLPTTANASQWGIRMQRNTLITEAQIVFSSATVIGSNENISIYLRVNDTTDYLIATVGSTDRARVFYNGSMNGGAGISLVSGDYVCVKVVPPAWGTNPTNTHMDGYWRALQT